MTLAGLMELPYGGTVSARPDMNIEQVTSLTYEGQSPFSTGIIGEERRKDMRMHGESVSWLRAIQSDTAHNRRSYVEMPLSDEVRVFIYENQNDIQSEEFGDIAKGETMISWMPDELQPQRDDRFVALGRTSEARQVLEPSDSVTRTLDHSRIVSIGAVYENGVKVSAVNYALGSGGIIWTNGYLPDVAVEVFFTHLRVYEFLAEKQMQGPRGQDGVRLPSRAPLRLLVEE